MVGGDNKKYTMEFSQRTFDPPKSISYYARLFDEDNNSVFEYKIIYTLEVLPDGKIRVQENVINLQLKFCCAPCVLGGVA